MPLADAPPIPPKKLNGMEITNAQGQLMTKKVSARFTHCPRSGGCPIRNKINGGSTASASAPKHTAGV